MTDEIEKKAWDYINKIEDMGGALKAIEAGFQKTEIENNAYEFQQNVEEGKEIIVGVNKFTTDLDEDIEVLSIDETAGKTQTEKLRKLREKRDNEKVETSLEKIKEIAGTKENLLPYMLNAIESYATIGEISNTLRSVWGEYK
jgi:methylmalonyl-CoA mutase N-terminal domain/subunit